MFIRRVLTRKDSEKSDLSSNINHKNVTLSETPEILQKVQLFQEKRTLSVFQLTPLWEYVIRTRKLPESLDPQDMFNEFLERLRDPEWQVRQHALRVLVDVLIVIGQKADAYFAPLVPQLVENLGHQAPTVRKGALDVLRVYISETAMPEAIILEVLDIGLNQRVTGEPFGGRLTCGVLLSLPSLILATLQSPKRNYILRSTIDILINKMNQVVHQEITLKVLLRIRDLIGPREFREFMTEKIYHEFEVLCNVYSLNSESEQETTKTSWSLLNPVDMDDSSSSMTYESNSKSSDSEIENVKFFCSSSSEEQITKVIMETQIKINEDTLTMRIVETKDNEQDIFSLSEDENETVNENSGLIQVLTDSELEDINGQVDYIFAPRSSKRVTFGGEVVKIRTPDSDVVRSDNETNNLIGNQMNTLTVQIQNDNTKPIKKVKAEHGLKGTSSSSSPSILSSSESLTWSPTTKRETDEISPKSNSPKSLFRRISISSVDDIISPKPPHKGIEVLHNLQRSPSISPTRPRRQSLKTDDEEDVLSDSDKRKSGNMSSEEPPKPKTWEDLNLVKSSVIKDLKSGDWRHRARAISSIEEALKPSENLALVQPYLDSLFRTLLSSEKNTEVAEDKRRIIMNLISRLPLDNLEERTSQIITGLCRLGGAGSNRVAKILMQRLPPAVIVLKLLSNEFLHARSSRFRENALQMVMYALITFPSTYFDTSTCVAQTTYAALDHKKRVRQASLDVLAILGQVTTPKTVMEVVERIANSRENGEKLCMAVKARLGRKKLPLVNSEGNIQYTLRIPSPKHEYDSSLKYLGADVEWIAAGIGSITPISLGKRSQDLVYTQADIDRVNIHETQHQRFGSDVTSAQNDASHNRFIKGNDKKQSSKVKSLSKAQGLNGTKSKNLSSFKMKNSFSFTDSSPDEKTADCIQNGHYNKLRSSKNSRFPLMQQYKDPYVYKSDRQITKNFNSYRAVLPLPKTDNLIQHNSQGINQDDSFNGKSFYKYYNDGFQNANQQDQLFKETEISTKSHLQKNQTSEDKNKDQSSNSLQNESDEFEQQVSSTITIDSKEPSNESKTPSTRSIMSNDMNSTLIKDQEYIENNKNVITRETQRPQSEQNTQSFEHFIQRPKTAFSDTQEPNNSINNSFQNLSNVKLIKEIKVEKTVVSADDIARLKDTSKSLSTEFLVNEQKSNQNAENQNEELLTEENLSTIMNDEPLPNTTNEMCIEKLQSESPSGSIENTELDGSILSEKMIYDDQLMTKSCDSIFHTDTKTEVDSKSTASTETSSDYQSSHAASLDELVRLSNYSNIKLVKAPLMKKSKTTLFPKTRKISPTKNLIKSSKAEIFPQTLTSYEKPRDALSQSLTQLDSSNWEIVMNGLQSLVRLIRHHTDLLETQLHMVCFQLANCVRNLRSQVARAACQAANEFFASGCKIDQECDDLAGSLLQRTADTNRFLRGDASKALESLCDNLAPSKILHILVTRGASHPNALVRTSTSKLLIRLAERIGAERIFNMNRETRDKFITTGANLLLEGSLETRSYAKALFRLLSGQPGYNRVLHEVIPPRTYRNIEKTLKSI